MNNKIGSYALSRNTKLGHQEYKHNKDDKQTALYRVRHVISESELAIVYSARDDIQGKKCIIKEFFPKAFFYRDKNNPNAKHRAKYAPEKYEMLLQAFLEECELLKLCQHQGVVGYIDQFEQNSTVYLVMEFCEGVTLDQYTQANGTTATPSFFYRSVLPFIQALEHIHAKGVIHRDLKPHNIMINEQGQLKLIDFGSAVRYPGTGYPIMTTAGYSPLELYSEKSAQGPMSDIYSLAAVIYYCCQGQAPRDVRQRLFDDTNISLPPSHHHSWKVLSKVVSRGLVVSPEKRLSSLTWFKRAIWLEYFTQFSIGSRRQSG